VGSRSKENLAYIAGFIDGDGSLMLQVKKRSDTKRGLRFMVTICLYQDSRHEKPLHWIRDVLRIGYVSKRRDGISELRVNGYKRGRDILVLLKPYFKFKKIQAKALLEACEILSSKPIQKLSTREQKKLVDLVLILQNENYVTKKKRSREELYEHLGLTP
jgi:hypothetical protein